MNEGNLIPFNKRTESEQREIARSGGKASGRARGFRAAAKKLVKENPDKIPAVLDAVYNEAVNGNMNASKLFIELCGEGEDDIDKKLKKAQIEKIKADTERIKAETELLRRKASDGETDDGDAAAALAQALDNSAAAVWKENDHYNDNDDKTDGI